MMTYDFDKLTQRRGTDCAKWDEAEDADILPLWVADMDFETAPCVAGAVQRRAAHPIYGYSLVPEGFYTAIREWNLRRHGWAVERPWIQYTSGVVPAVSAILQGLCREGDAVLTLTPAYNCFFSSIRNSRCRLVDFPLTWDAAAETHTIDFGRLEQTLCREQVRLLLLCNPHNPSGRVWTQQELHTMAALCKQHDVIVVSDEIHCEFVNPQLGRPYIPFGRIAAEVGCRWVVTNAPNKAFNTAGLQTAYIVCPDEELRRRIDRAINDNEVCDINVFSFVALQAAYSADGEEWLRQLTDYIYEGYRLLRQQLKSAFPTLPIARLEGTYLAWVDVRPLLPQGLTSEALATRLRERHHVWLNGGELYGRSGFLRINLATQHARLSEATRRIVLGLREIAAQSS